MRFSTIVFAAIVFLNPLNSELSEGSSGSSQNFSGDSEVTRPETPSFLLPEEASARNDSIPTVYSSQIPVPQQYTAPPDIEARRQHYMDLFRIKSRAHVDKMPKRTSVTVSPNGGGLYGTIQEAIDAAADGDTIFLDNGIFTGPGNRDIDFLGKKIVIISIANDPESCVIDCGGTPEEPHRGFYFHNNETEDSIICGVTITNGFDPNFGGGIFVTNGSRPTIRNCIVTNNAVADDGGGICIRYADAIVENCLIMSNTSFGDPSWEGNNAGGIECYHAYATILRNNIIALNAAGGGPGGFWLVRCVVEFTNNIVGENSAPSGGGGWIHRADGTVFSGNIFLGNDATVNSSALYIYNCNLVIQNSTIAFNLGSVAPLLAISANVSIEDSIIAFNEGPAVTEGPFLLTCCDLYGNTSGDWIGDIAGQLGTNGNISEDPLFCDSSVGDFTLNQTSPCAQENNPECGQIGALPVGCGSSYLFVATTGSDETGDGSESNPFATIQHAIDGASTGNSVVLADGTYTGPGNQNIDLNGLDLVVVSASLNPAACIIDAGGEVGFRMHSYESPACELSSLTITNASAGVLIGLPGEEFGIGASPTIRNCTFAQSLTGIEVHGEPSSPLVTGCLLTGNDSGISCHDEVQGGRVENSRITGSTGHGIFTDGVFTHGDFPLVVEDCEIDNNGGSGISNAAGFGHVTVVNGDVHDNGEWGLITQTGNQAGSVVVQGGSIYRNGLGGHNGAFSEYDVLSDCEIYENNGPGILTGWDYSLSVTNCIVRDNVGNGFSSGYIRKSENERIDRSGSISGCEIFGNAGHGIFFGDNWWVNRVSACTIYQNDGAGISISEYYDPGNGDPQIFVENTTIVQNLMGIQVLSDIPVFIDNSLIAFNSGVAIECDVGRNVTVGCSNLYGNTGGNEPVCLPGIFGTNNNISLDPIFCNLDAGNFSLASNSPCTADNNIECGQIGALPVGCGPVSIFVATTGSDDTGDGSEGNPYATIQHAIDGAGNGNTVVLADGIYTGDGNRDLDFRDKKIVVRSLNDDPDLCVINCEGSPAEPHRGVIFDGLEDQSTVLRGLTIRGGYAADYGGGILIASEDWASNPNPRIENCIVTENVANWGAGFAVTDVCSPSFHDCQFLNNSGPGGGWYNHESPRVGSSVVEDCRFEGNSVGAEVFCPSMDGIIAMTRCVITANNGYGFNFSVSEGGAILDNCEITGNGSWGLKLFHTHKDLAKVEMETRVEYSVTRNCYIAGNTQGGITLLGDEDASGRFVDCLIEDNLGPGISCGEGGGAPRIEGNVVRRNSGNGLLIENYASSVIISGNEINDNELAGISVRNLFWWDMTIQDNLVYGNQGSGFVFSAVYDNYEISGNTFVANGENGITWSGSEQGVVANNILAFNELYGFECPSGLPPELTCTNFFGNLSGAGTTGINEQVGIRGNISSNPLFCDLDAGNFSLASNSPCTAGNNTECGQIGALPVGCAEDGTVLIGDIQNYDPETGNPMSPYENGMVTVTGVVYAVKGTLSAGGYHIQDETGGINCYSPYADGFSLGDRIRVTAAVYSYYGEIYIADIEPPTFELIAHGPELEPLDLTVSELISDYENVGWFVRLTGTINDIQANSFNLIQNDDSVSVVISDLSGIDLTGIQNDDSITVQGACLVRNGVMQVWPRYPTDLLQSPPEITRLVISPLQGDPIPCDGAALLSFSYQPANDTMPVKGYSIRVVAESSVSFSASDFTVNNLPTGEQVYHQIIENGVNDFTLDYTILGSTTGGITTAETLFTVTYHGVDDGAAVVSIAAADFRDLENVSIPVDFGSLATIVVDCGPPEAVADVLAVPGHGRVTLTWSDPSDADISSMLVYRGYWHDGSLGSVYPGYGQIPGNTVPEQFPEYQQYLSSSEWELAGTINLGVGTFVDPVVTRGIYFYQVFAIDSSGNGSPPLDDSPAATNYILGDVAMPYDGEVDIADLSMLGDSYGVGCGHQYFNDEVDIGPTASGSSQDIPVPDCQVQFEDLIIFSFNFGSSSSQKAPLSDPADLVLAWVQDSDHEWSCILVEPCPALKGIHLVGNGPGLGDVQVERGALLGQQPGPVFLQKAESPMLDVGLAVMGAGQGFEGSGELFRISVSAPVESYNVTLEARSTVNEVMEFQLLDYEPTAVPTRYALGHNYPNPFNPSTTISFSLPEVQEVDLCIYSVDGRRIRNLVSGLKQAGSYDVVWEGRDDRGHGVASGIYFYRLEAGTFSETRKMVLMK